MGHMPDNLIDLVITSPPYDNLRSYHGYLFDFENIARGLFRVVKAGGVIVWVVGDQTQNGSESGSSFKQVLYFKELGFNLHDTMIYKKGHPIPLNHNRYEQEFEYMFILSKGRPKTFNPIMIPCKLSGVKTGKRTFYQTKDQDAPTMAHKVAPVKETKIKGNIWEIYNSGGIKGHPAQFPEQLVYDHLISWSNEGDLIYDPFMGSGTTAIVAKMNGRNYIGSEISEKYCAIAEERLT
jgi:site-specific DNA-methyltransferase (adenine-specific)